MNATLKIPYLGYTRIELIEKRGFKWLARIIESGKEIEVYEDEFERDWIYTFLIFIGYTNRKKQRIMLLFRKPISKKIKSLKKGDKVRVLFAPKGGISCGVNGFKGYEGIIDKIDIEEILHIPNGFGGSKKVRGYIFLKGETSWLILNGLNIVKLEKINW
jgi:hypothetical protein